MRSKQKKHFPDLAAISPNLAVFTLGLVLFTGGIYFIYPPAALIGPGIILMAISIFGGRQS